jgi:hypothetical protein
MGKANDKKVTKETRDLLLCTLGNLLESQRERKFRSSRNKSLTRRQFCHDNRNLIEATVSHIETGRFLNLRFDQLRVYLAAVYATNNANFIDSFRRVYDGLKEIDELLRML